MLLKLNHTKAYDKVQRHFLQEVLAKFHFSEHWIKWVNRGFSTASFAVLINVGPSSFFEDSRGRREGCPVSPFLFIILVESLGRSLAKVDQRAQSKE